jgi:hypothetical protein
MIYCIDLMICIWTIVYWKCVKTKKFNHVQIADLFALNSSRQRSLTVLSCWEVWNERNVHSPSYNAKTSIVIQLSHGLRKMTWWNAKSAEFDYDGSQKMRQAEASICMDLIGPMQIEISGHLMVRSNRGASRHWGSLARGWSDRLGGMLERTEEGDRGGRQEGMRTHWFHLPQGNWKC